MKEFKTYLKENEKSPATIEKYIRDVKHFFSFAAGRSISKQLVIDYKEHLTQNYAITSANSMLAALNVYLEFMGCKECAVKRFAVQKSAYCSENKELTREEYNRLVRAAQTKGDQRLKLIIQTICATGIRVSELEHITVEAVKKGEAEVACKGKIRRIFIVKELRRKLDIYIRKKKISTGAIFVTRNGNPISRHSVWKQMKNLCSLAQVAAEKVFPHNLRHLFARLFYEIEKDIVKLADVLGHTSINTTRIYTVTTGIQHRKKMESLHLII